MKYGLMAISGVCPDRQRIAVGRRIGDVARADGAARARPVLDHDRLAKFDRVSPADDPADDVAGASGLES